MQYFYMGAFVHRRNKRIRYQDNRKVVRKTRDMFAGDGLLANEAVDYVAAGDDTDGVFAGDDAVDEGQQPGVGAADGGPLHGRPHLRQPGLHRRVHRRDARVRERAHRRVVGAHHPHHRGLRGLLPDLRQRLLHRLGLCHHGAAASGHAHRHHRHQLLNLLREPRLLRAAPNALHLHKGGAGQRQPLRKAAKRGQHRRPHP